MKIALHITTWCLLPITLVFAACGGQADQTTAITDPTAPGTIAALFGGALEPDGQRVMRDPSPEESERLGAQPGDKLETVLFKTLPIEGGPTLLFHATYVYSNGARQQCRACTMTISAAAFMQGPGGAWEQMAFKRNFADVSAAYEELPVEAITLGDGRWLLEHESCWCGAGGDCMCDKTWYALETDPGWLEPVLSKGYHYSHEDDKTVYAEELSLGPLAGQGIFPDMEMKHTFTESPVQRKARGSTREERTRYTYDPAQKKYMPVEP